MPRATFDDSNPPDWERLSELSTEIDKLKAAGKWDRAAFERLFAEGELAVNGHNEFLEFVANEAAPDWM